jgi:glycosyltransferase involved in cell wall biosynthesis
VSSERQAPIRVLHVITRMIVGGAQEYALLSVEGLDRLPAFDVSLASGIDRGAEGDLVSQTRPRVDLIVIPELCRNINPVSDAIAIWKLQSLMRKRRYHVVQTHTAKAGVLGRLAARLARTPIVIHTLHGVVFNEQQSWLVNRTWWAIQKVCAPLTDHFVTVSNVVGQKAVDAGIAAADKLSTIYNGMELDWFLDARVDTAAVRRQLGIPDAAPVVGKIARMAQVKNHDLLLDAAPRIIAQHPGVRFLLVGDGPLLEHLRARVDAMGMREHVVFTGLVARERIPQMLAVMDVLVHTALYEGMPRVFVQALAMGKPCVAFDADGTREVVIPEETGCLVQPGDTWGIAAAVNHLLADSERRERMGQAGRRFVDPTFRAETMVLQMAALYQSLVQRHADRIAAFDARHA